MKVAITTHDRCHVEIRHFIDEANASGANVEFRQVRLNQPEKDALYGDALDAPAACAAAARCRESYRIGADDVFIVIAQATSRTTKTTNTSSRRSRVRTRGASDGILKTGIVSLYYLDPRSSFVRDGPRRDRARSHRVGSILLNLLSATASLVTGLDFHSDTRGCVMDYCQRPADIAQALRGGLGFCDVCAPLAVGLPHGPDLLRLAEWSRSRPLRQQALPAGQFDVFLCYSRDDTDPVRTVYRDLVKSGVVPWLDEEECRPGLQWQDALEEQIEKITQRRFSSGNRARAVAEAGGERVPSTIRRAELSADPVILPGVQGQPAARFARRAYLGRLPRARSARAADLGRDGRSAAAPVADRPADSPLRPVSTAAGR
jgi:hypothetical protein